MVTLTRLFALFLLFLASCSSPQKPNHLRISFNTQPTTLDPRKCGDFASSTLVSMIYEGLTRCMPGGAVEPALAEKFEVSDDGKVYLFHLRRAFWSDGKPITAYDFESSWKKNLNPPSLSAHLFYPIKNGEKCAKGEVPSSELGVWALDERTLRVELEHPTSYFYSLTAFPSYFPVPSHVDNPEGISSGPFCIEKMVRNSEISLSKNQKFWNRRKVFLDQIHISIIPEETTALQMFERGELDWVGGALSPLPPDALETIQKRHTIHCIPNAGTTFCTFNTQTAPFQNIHLRRAFSLAIDRTEIVEKIVQFGQIPATRILPPSLAKTHKKLLPLTNKEEAQKEFKKAMEELQKIDPLTFYFRTGQIDKRLAQTLQKQWEETLGVTIKLVQLDEKSHAQKLQQRDYQIALTSWIAQFDDPISILERFKNRTNLKNYCGWEDPAYALLLEEATQSPRRIELLETAETLFAEQMPLTPIYHWSSPVLYSPRIQQIGTTPCGGILFDRFILGGIQKSEGAKEAP